MILIIDNYDSFTYNLVQAIGTMGYEIEVFRNDKITPDEIAKKHPSHVIISPGPGTPKEAGISKEVVKRFTGEIPILGVCLGHQSIGEALGGEVVRSGYVMHGKTSMIHHDGKTIFAGVDNPFEATRYHSLIVKRETLPDIFEVSAWTEDGTIMGIRHKQHITEGVQFHPESFLTEVGKKVLANFLNLCY